MINAAIGVTVGGIAVGAEANKPVALFSNQRPSTYLDVTEAAARRLKIAGPIADFSRGFRAMTGRDLPRAGGQPRRFDPTRPETTRFQCRVVSFGDTSPYAGPNAQVGLVLSPVHHFTRSPFAEAGEKVGWTCTWDKATGKLVLALTVANQAYYGPGYGPYTFVELTTEAPVFAAGGSLRLALEVRNSGKECLRGSYSIDNKPWITTAWFDPTEAGIDQQAPGKSNRNGPQAWGKDWVDRWRNATTFHLTAYHPKGRKAAITVAEAQVTRDETVLFASSFAAAKRNAGSFADWAVCPDHGTATVTDDGAVLEPVPGGWHTVGLRAQQDSQIDTTEMVPIRAKLLDLPAGVSRFDAPTVQSFEIDVSRRAIELRAHSALGLQNALYYLLYLWGCRWVIPGELGECIPQHAELTLPEGTMRITPYADTSMDRSPFSAWQDRNLGGWQHWLSGQHYWLHAIPPEKHFADHPEWFSLLGGDRRPRQLCTANPRVIAEMIEAAKAYLKRSPTAASFPMDPNDNIDFCQCTDCTALDVPGARIRGAPSVTDRVLTFVNAVAEGIKDEFPDRYVAFYAYWTHIDPPQRVRPADNVVVIVCRSKHCLLHLTPTDGCPTSDFHTLVRDWRRLTPNVYTYEYDPISWIGGLPCPTYLDMAESLKHLLTVVGVKGSYSDGAQYAAHASSYINRYMARRMKADPTQEPLQVLRDTCSHFFGPAGQDMTQYYQELARVTEADHQGRSRVGGGSTFFHAIFEPDIVQNARACLDRSLALCQDRSPYDTRLRMIDMSQRYLEAYLDGVWSAEKHHYAAAVAAFDRMESVIDEMDAPGYLDAKDARRRAKTMRLKALAEHFPERLGFVTRWKLLGPFDNTAHNGHLVQDTFEPIRTLDSPVETTDGATLDWRDYSSNSGMLNLEQAFADSPKNWTLSYAYAGTTIKSPEARIAQLRMDSFFPYRVYANGKEVFYRAGLNADCPDRQLVNVQLDAGDNAIVIKLSQTMLTSDTFPWGLYFRVVREGEDAAVFSGP